MIKNGTLLKSNNSNFKYYKTIVRTRDLLKSAELSTMGSRHLFISNYYISPASVKFDNLVEETIYELNDVLIKKIRLPKSDNILTSSLEKYIADNEHFENESTTFKDYLEKEGHTGILSKVASNINVSTIDQFTRAILSKAGIFFYLAYRAIEGNGVADVEGIGLKILESIGIVKSYINTSLVDKLIDKEHLQVSDDVRAKTKKYIENRNIGYYQGNPEKVITAIVDDLIDGRGLYTLVRDFLKSDKVSLDRNINEDHLVEKMVDYLLKIGYNPDNQTPVESIINVTKERPDNFENSIVGMTKELNDRLNEAGIIRFYQLADHTPETLNKLLGDSSDVFDYKAIIIQAQLIARGDFKRLAELQNKLYKRK